MFWSKVFVAENHIVLAMCDEDLIGKSIKDDDGLEVEINENFYGENIIKDEEAAVKLMNDCTIANIIGEHITALAKKHDFITEENIISIGGIPHAQFIKC